MTATVYICVLPPLFLHYTHAVLPHLLLLYLKKKKKTINIKKKKDKNLKLQKYDHLMGPYKTIKKKSFVFKNVLNMENNILAYTHLP